jgi:ATP-dependent Zn protease
MAALTPGFAGADIANVCNESAIFAARRNAEGVEMMDFERATERVMGGLPKENSIMSPEERRTVALHEAGHAIAGWFLENADPLLKVSILPRSGGALGFAQYLPQEMSLHSQQSILDKMAVALGGRAAEELFVGKISTGASDDLARVTKMAYAMVSVYGMNPKIGLVSYKSEQENQFYKPYSEATAQLIDSEAQMIIDAQYTRVKELLSEKMDLAHAMADELIKEDTLVYAQLVKILGERPFGIAQSYRAFVTASGNPFTAGFDDAKDAAAADDTTQAETKEKDAAAADDTTKAETKDATEEFKSAPAESQAPSAESKNPSAESKESKAPSQGN